MLINYSNRYGDIIDTLTNLWKVSISASHFFLTDEDINKLIPFVRNGIRDIETLIVAEENDLIIGFMGIDGKKLEMLFIEPSYFGKGLGKQLVALALNEYKINYVDVNEQNLRAVGFYQRLGFEVFERTELDEQGNPFPILKMKIR
ncbi:Acyl-CoA N-acyltransferase [Syntrophomonas zehnderi OL-4]|uniref:Acyl-CoA N-acyltransferase n=2 Tax=Syntrophomonas TaxID=862 RepID=A0A0E4C9N7_9FIRM|nr:Acyl-CoA N-acyltransferase [Syntrophomonas zehnderi OL-4]